MMEEGSDADPGWVTDFDPSEPLAWPLETAQLVDEDAPWSFAVPSSPADMIANGEVRAFWVSEFGNTDQVAWEQFLRAFSRRFNVGAVPDDVPQGAFVGLRDGIFKSEGAWAGERRVVSVADIARVFPPQETVAHRAAAMLAGGEARSGIKRATRFYGQARDHNPLVFKGRSGEVDALLQSLVGDIARVFAISGPAGCGKSAAASFLGHMATDPTLPPRETACPGGCLRVDLRGIQASEPACVLTALASALHLSAGTELESAVRAFCRDRPGRFLMILDNVDSTCMRSQALAETVAELLRFSEHCRVLVTSRGASDLASLSGYAFDTEHHVALPPTLSLEEARDLVAVLAPRFTRTGQTDALCFACGNAPLPLTLACKMLVSDSEGERFSKLLAVLEDDPEADQAGGPWLPSISVGEEITGISEIRVELPFFRVGEGDHSKFGPLSLSGDGKAESILRIMWEELSPENRGHVTALSIFPGSFSSVSAALVLGRHIHEVDRLLAELKTKEIVVDAPTPFGAACTSGRRFEVYRPLAHYAARSTLMPGNNSPTSGSRSRFVELVSRMICGISRCVSGGPMGADGAWIREIPLLLFDAERHNVDEVIRLACGDSILADADATPLARLLANNLPLVACRISASARHAFASAVLGMAQRAVTPHLKLEEGVMLELIGRSNAELGHMDAASEFLRLAFDFLAKELGPGHPRLASALDALAAIHRETGSLSQSLEALHTSLTIRKEFFGPNHTETAKALQAIAAVARSNGEPILARELLEESLTCVAEAHRKNAPGHPDVTLALHLLGDVCKELEDWDAAARHYGHAIADLDTLFPVTRWTADAFERMAFLFETRQMHIHALDYMERALVVRRRVLGEMSQTVATTMVAMSVMHLARDAPKQALRLLDEALKVQRRVLDEEDPDLASTYNNIGIACFMQKHFAHALTNFERALKIRTRALGSESEEAAHCLSNIGMCACATRDYTKALNSLQEALPIFQSIAEEREQESSDVARTLSNLGVVYAALKDKGTARKCYTQSLAIWSVIGEPSGPAAADVEANLGDLEGSTGEHACALPHYLQCLKSRENSLGRSHPATVSACVHVAETYGVLGKDSLAIALLEKASDAISLRKGGSGRNAKEAAVIATATGVHHAMGGHFDAAEHACKRAMAILEAEGLRESPAMARALECAGCCCIDRGDVDKAETLFARALATCNGLARGGTAEKVDASSNALLVAPAQRGLALVRLARGDAQGAAASLNEAYALLEGALGASHPATMDAATMANVAREHLARGKAPESASADLASSLLRPRGTACAAFARNARMLSLDLSVGAHQHRVSR